MKTSEELSAARAILREASGSGSKKEIEEARAYMRQVIKEARLTPGARVQVIARPGRLSRFAGQSGAVIRRDRGREFLIRLEALGLDALVDSRDLKPLKKARP